MLPSSFPTSGENVASPRSCPRAELVPCSSREAQLLPDHQHLGTQRWVSTKLPLPWARLGGQRGGGSPQEGCPCPNGGSETGREGQLSHLHARWASSTTKTLSLLGNPRPDGAEPNALLGDWEPAPAPAPRGDADPHPTPQPSPTAGEAAHPWKAPSAGCVSPIRNSISRLPVAKGSAAPCAVEGGIGANRRT